MTTAVAPSAAKVPDRFDTCRDFIFKNQKTLAAMMPKVLKVDRFIRVALNEISKNPKLMECTPSSLMGALLQCAQFGLEPNSILGHAYLVPFNNTRMRRMEVQLIPGYKGLMALARRSGEISVIDAHEVHANDQFEFSYGTDPKLIHKPAKKDRGAIEYFYAICKMKDGGVQFVVLSMEDVQEHRTRFSKAANQGPWVDNFEEMAKKTCLRKVCKYIPASVELQQAVMLDELGESGVPQGLSALAGDVEPEEETADTSAEDKKMDDIREQLKQTKADSTPEAPPRPSKATESLPKAAAKVTDPVPASDKEPPPKTDAPGTVSDETWALFVDYVDDDTARAQLKKHVKEKMQLGNLRELKGEGRVHFILTMQDQAKKAGIPFEIYVKD